MSAYFKMILFYPYPYQKEAWFIGFILMVVIALPFYGIYRLIIHRMTENGKAVFHRILKISGICLLVVFFVQMTLALITEHQVNKQLGFSYATPETPEGEFFIITKVVPGGIMDKAGLQAEDRVLMNSTSKLYRRLIRNQGGEAEIIILRDEKEITIRVMVPAIELPFSRIAFILYN